MPFNEFLNVHVTGDDANQWIFPGSVDETYVPRIYFLNWKGEFVDVRSGNQKFPRFISTGEDLRKVMVDFLNERDRLLEEEEEEEEEANSKDKRKEL